MTREEAINVLEGYKVVGMRSGKMQLFKALCLAVAALRAQQDNAPTLNGWISVKDRLPKKSGDYIVTACDEGCPAGEGIWYSTVVVVAEYYHGSWTWYEGGNEWSLEDIVTHWMPLPEPPEEDTHE